MKRILTLGFVLLAASTVSFAIDANTWKNMDIYGGQIWALAMQPSHHNVLLAGGIKTIYKSTDSGATWASKGIDGGIIGITFAPSNPDIVYVIGGSAGFYKSSDAGETWSSRSIPAGVGFANVACDPADPNIVYACSRQTTPIKIYKSADGGATWTEKHSLDAGFTPSRMAVVTSTVIIVTTNKNYDEDGAIYRSMDAGDTWVPVASFTGLDSSPGNRPLYSLAVDSANPNNIYAGGRKYFFKSADMGATWSATDVSTMLNTSNRRTVMLTVKGGNTLLACNELNLFQSANGGATWTPVAPIDTTSSGPFGNMCDLIYDDTNSFLYLADSNGRGVYKSTDCVTFTPANTNIKGVRFLFLTRNPIDRNIFYAGSDVDLYRSTDTGQSWQTLPMLNGLRAGAGDIIVHPSSSSVVFACQQTTGGNVICKSTDTGNTWQSIYNMPFNAGGVLKFAFDPTNPEIMYAGVGSGIMSPQSDDGLYKSIDGGATWTRAAFPGAAISNIVFDPSNPQVVYASKGMFYQQTNANTTGAFRSNDGGATWSQMTGVPQVKVSGLMLDPGNPRTIYATATDEVDKSLDGGTTWTRIASQAGGINAFTISTSTDGKKVLFYATNNGINMSSDDGATWQQFSSGFNSINVLCPGSLYVGTNTGLYKTEIVLAGGAGSSLNNIKVYPNPYDPALHTQGVTFANLPSDAEIKIYNVAGELVRGIDGTPQGGLIKWDGKNNGGKAVVRGVYIALIKSSTDTKLLKIAVGK